MIPVIVIIVFDHEMCLGSTVCSLIKLNATVTSWHLAGSAIIYVSSFYCFHGAVLGSYQEDVVELGSGSCSSS
jgi:hypothetical protein